MKRNKKGFTLAELLIVVAIIAVLVAIAIPIFTGQLNKARASTDAANIRAGYAEVATKTLEEEVPANTVYYLQADGTVATTTTSLYACKGAATNLTDTTTYIGTTQATSIDWVVGSNIQYTVNNNGIAIAIKPTT